jgi:two-component sensor histidine kinase
MTTRSQYRQRPTTLNVTSDGGSVTSREAVSLGLIITELILNALKHAFPENKMDRQIAVGFDVAGTNWKLSVVDNGIGAPVGVFAQAKTGLGTSIINALAQQLEARVEVLSTPPGDDSDGRPRHIRKDTPSRVQRRGPYAAVNSRACLTTLDASYGFR